MRSKHITLLAVAIHGLVLAQVAPSQSAGSATGTLTVGSSKFKLAHAYAFPDKANADPAQETYRIVVTDRPLSAAVTKLAVSAGANEEDRQQLAVELADQKIHGVEMVVGADKRVTRVNIYSPDAAMGLMLLTPGQFEATAFDAQRIAGKVFTAAPIKDSRIGKAIQYEATFSATVTRSTKK